MNKPIKSRLLAGVLGVLVVGGGVLAGAAPAQAATYSGVYGSGSACAAAQRQYQQAGYLIVESCRLKGLGPGWVFLYQ